jgi:hypothetical protein
MRRMKDANFRQLQWQHRYDLHVEPINRMADGYKDEGRPMPYIAPAHGGVDARMLFILRDPGPKTADPDREDVRWLCVENDDQTAERFCGLLERADIAIRDTMPWNAYPWYINAAPSRAQLRDGLVPLQSLLTLMTDLRVIVLMGREAEASWDLLQPGLQLLPSVEVLRTRHPSNQAFVGTAEQRAQWREEQALVMEHAGEIMRARRHF